MKKLSHKKFSRENLIEGIEGDRTSLSLWIHHRQRANDEAENFMVNFTWKNIENIILSSFS